MNSTAVIAAVGLSKIFRDFWRRARVQAVRDLDLDVQPGEIYGLLGPNGSGKSTTIKMLLGLLYPTRGRISVFGKPATDVAVKSRIGYLPEESYLYRFLNARETLHFYGQLFQIPRRERVRRIEELLDMVGLSSAARRPVGEYSKGMQRRIGLAQALINAPELLILDEPTSGLDPVGSKLVKDVILRIGNEYGTTILLSSHLLADVEEVCGRVTILYGGRVQVSGRMQDVLAQQDQIQINCAVLSEQTLCEVRELVRRREGKDLLVSTPMARLEDLFLRVVREAHEQKMETAGSAAAGEIAGFLGDKAAGAAVLETLTRPADEPVRRTPSAPEPGHPGVAVLDSLTRDEAPAPTEPEANRAAGPAADRGLLDELTGGPEERK